MPALATKQLVASVERQLHRQEGLGHLRVRAYGPLLTIESGPTRCPVRHARLRRETVSLWSLEIAGPAGAWQPTALRDTKERLLAVLVEQFGWVLTPRDDTPWKPGAD